MTETNDQTTAEGTEGATALTPGSTSVRSSAATTDIETSARAQDVTSPGTTDAEDSQPETESRGREARYRTRLRETETERDGLRQKVTSMQRAEAERLAGTVLDKGAGLWTGGVELDDLLDEDGNVDPALVTAAAETAAEEVGLRPVNVRPRPDSSQGGATGQLDGDAWSAAFRPRRG